MEKYEVWIGIQWHKVTPSLMKISPLIQKLEGEHTLRQHCNLMSLLFLLKKGNC
jgi:hypothetical protein